jgi:hypothetical protein
MALGITSRERRHVASTFAVNRPVRLIFLAGALGLMFVVAIGLGLALAYLVQ